MNVVPDMPIYGATQAHNVGGEIVILGQACPVPVSITRTTIPLGQPDCFAGLHFFFIGTLPTLGRDEAFRLVQKYNGRILTSVPKKKKLDYVVMGLPEQPGRFAQSWLQDSHSDTLAKLQALGGGGGGSTFLDEAGFLALLRDSVPVAERQPPQLETETVEILVPAVGEETDRMAILEAIMAMDGVHGGGDDGTGTGTDNMAFRWLTLPGEPPEGYERMAMVSLPAPQLAADR